MCAHMHVSLRAGEKVQEWTFTPNNTQKIGGIFAPWGSSPARQDKDRFHGGMARNTEAAAQREKCIMICVVTAMTFGQLWLLSVHRRRDGES